MARGDAFYTPPLIAKTIVAQGLLALGIGDGDFEENPKQAIRDAQVGLKAILHVAKTLPATPVSDDAIQAQLRAQISRLDYALELIQEPNA